MTDPTPNLPLLRKVLDHIDAHPDEWAQHCWAVQWDSPAGRAIANEYGVQGPPCGTAYCIAGTVATWAGWEPVSFDRVGSRPIVKISDAHTIPWLRRARLVAEDD